MATYVQSYMMAGEKKIEGSSGIFHKKAVCNDLLSNILWGIHHGNPEDLIIQAIDDHFSPEEVFDARRIIFKNFYSLFADDPNDPTEDRLMGAKEKEIKKLWHLQDILEKIHVISKLEHDVEICIPWNHKYVIMTEEETRFREIMNEKDEKFNKKFVALEKVIDLQNRATIMAVETSMKDSLETIRDVMNEKKSEMSNEIFEDAEVLKGSAEAVGVKDGPATRYIPRHFDIQILNSLIICCVFGFVIRFAQLFLKSFSINI